MPVDWLPMKHEERMAGQTIAAACLGNLRCSFGSQRSLRAVPSQRTSFSISIAGERLYPLHGPRTADLNGRRADWGYDKGRADDGLRTARMVPVPATLRSWVGR